MKSKSSLYDKLISDENIYLAIYSVKSYVNNIELLSYKDRKLLSGLTDKYNTDIIYDCIKKVRNEIEKLIHQNDYFVECTVYFKPKKYNNNDNNIEFRPLHTTKIINQIALVSMLNLLIYENEEKIELSSLSRLIPSNFYGNRIALEPELLYKVWNKQYKEYTSTANELFAKFRKNEEYRYEIDLDIQNFFPSINPEMLFNYIVSKLSVALDEDDLKLMKTVIIKLLYCIIEKDNIDERTIGRYYTNQDISKIDTKFTMGIPQGLPQSYFFANICMIEISKKFNSVFKGISLYYVDDSVIFTNSLYEKEEEFENMLVNINELIKEFTNEYYNLGDSFIKQYNRKIFNFNNIIKYEIRVHDGNGKSTYTDILSASIGETYLKNISREASKTAFDLNTSYSDNEDIILKNKVSTLLGEIRKEISLVETNIYNHNHISEENLDIDKEKNYLEKLIRYKKFFQYRKSILDYRESNDYESVFKELFNKLEIVVNQDNGMDEFFKFYNEDILEAMICFALENKYKYNKDSNDFKSFIEILKKLNKKLFGYDNNQSSYINRLYEKYEKDEIILKDITPYETLNKIIKNKYPRAKKMHENNIIQYYMNKVEMLKKSPFWEQLNIFDAKFYNTIKYVDQNTDEIKRNVLNAFFSYIFNIEIDDTYNFAKKENRMLNYRELRTLSYVRNKCFIYERFIINLENFMKKDNELKIDYNILEVMRCFKTFVKYPDLIDNLILIHKYTCDVWKNGSKYLYFYTLHNQEHAVDLIKSSIDIVKIIDYIQISKLDYYILFISCYLHDISMVTLPRLDEIQIDSPQSNKIYVDFIKDLERIGKLDNSRKIKKLLKDYYKKIDEFYEIKIRSDHAKNSAKEIRNRQDLNFIDKCLRDVIAEVSEAHGYSVEDVYKVKSVASEHLVSKKFMKIILRIADLLDMSNYRVSKPILTNNINNMSQVSAFHWLSHLITESHNFEVEYIPEYATSKDIDTPNSFLKSKGIIEKIILNIHVNFSQLTKEKIGEPCTNVKIDKIMGEEGFLLKCGEACKGEKCNFLCKWIVEKNYYLFEEFQALKRYLNNTHDNYFKSDIYVKIKINSKTNLTPQQFEIIKKYINKE